MCIRREHVDWEPEMLARVFFNWAVCMYSIGCQDEIIQFFLGFRMGIRRVLRMCPELASVIVGAAGFAAEHDLCRMLWMLKPQLDRIGMDGIRDMVREADDWRVQEWVRLKYPEF